MTDTKQQSLISAMSYCGVRDLPKEWDKENVYLRALALVRKNDGTESYALLQKGADGKDAIIKDFGTVSLISEIISVHPFYFLDSKWMPFFKTRSKDERLTWLSRHNVEGDFSSLTVKELDKVVLNTAMQNALQSINNE